MYSVIYLASGRAVLKYKNVVYNDYFEKRDLVCDMMSVDLSKFDILIATPPCNYYSRCNYRRDVSDYALSTKHLLPDILDKFIKFDKPFIIENVRNDRLFKQFGLYDKNCFVYKHGRHTYWTNIMFNMSNIPQHFDFYTLNGHCARVNSYCQGGSNVNDVLDYFIECACAYLDRVGRSDYE